MVLVSNFNSSESGSINRESKRQFIDVCLYFYHLSLWVFHVFFLFLCFFFLFFLPPFPFIPPFSLFTITPFYTICHGGICPFYPSTAFGSLWTSFQDCLLACQLLSHYHCSDVLVAPLFIRRLNCLSCFLPLSVFHLPHPDKD